MGYELSEPINGAHLSSISATPFGGSGGYDAVKTTNRRRGPVTKTSDEDNQLKMKGRRSMAATTRDLRRNFSIARWMIRKHLDFVVRHTFRASTGDVEFNRRLEKFVEKISRKEFFDVQQRHPRRRFMRILEASRVVDGDIFGVKIAGGFLQAIEGDRVFDPDFSKLKREDSLEERARWVNGLRRGKFGRVEEFAVHRRKKKGFEFEKTVRMSRGIQFGYYDRVDQYRGISPLASAVNPLRDTYDNFDYTSAKNKVRQLFALKITRQAEEGFGNNEFDSDGEDGNEVKDRSEYHIDFSGGPQFLDLDQGDDAAFLGGDNPGTNEHKFWQMLISVSLKALDLPFSFFDEAYTNFFGSRAALMLYLKSVFDKRADVVDFLNEWLCWRLSLAIAHGELEAPADFTCDPESWNWIPTGVPWWNPAQEVKADVESINNHLRDYAEIRSERFGDDWYEMMERKKEQLAFMADSGFVPGNVEQVQQVEVVNNGEE